jgi:glutamine synthetase adenylyltransferase
MMSEQALLERALELVSNDVDISDTLSLLQSKVTAIKDLAQRKGFYEVISCQLLKKPELYDSFIKLLIRDYSSTDPQLRGLAARYLFNLK